MISTFSAAVVALLAASVVTVGAAGTASAAASPQVFACANGAVADYVVPAGVTSVRVRAEGGGNGGVVEATVAVAPGQSLGVIAGCAGGAGRHWGGSGGPSRDGSCADGVPGAGSGAVLTGDYDEVIVEAGGSGGAGGDCAGNAGGAGGSDSQTGADGAAGPGPRPAAGGRGGLRATGLGDNGRAGRGRTGAGGGGGCRGGGSGQGGANQAGAGGGGGSSCAGRFADAVSFGTGGAGLVVIGPELLTATNGGSDVVDANGNGRQDIGDRIEYWVTVRNDGSVPVTGVAVIARLGSLPLPLTCSPASLAPGETLTAHGTSPSATVVTSAPTTVESEVSSVPELTVTTQAETDGTVVTYAVVVTNTGTVTLHDVSTVDCTAELAPGESTTCEGEHKITQADVDRGFVMTTTPSGERITSAPATVTTKITAPTPAARTGGGLASTGITAVTEMIVTGVVVLALGLGLLLFTRRRRRDQ